MAMTKHSISVCYKITILLLSCCIFMFNIAKTNRRIRCVYSGCSSSAGGKGAYWGGDFNDTGDASQGHYGN